ncbi:hypothetical protein KJ605_02905, partial [Patescibacteria group bacterium]|nr:hypothetical protein [Patescibacteria group bacterium]
PEPILVSRNVGVAAANWVGKDSTHLSLKLLANQQLYKAIIFDARQLGAFGFDLGTRLDIAYMVSSRTYRDTPYLDLVIKDFCVLGNG